MLTSAALAANPFRTCKEQPTMSEPTPPVEAAPPAEWPALSLHERRVLGVLVEKAKTTPEVYPLTLNALVTGCNQKSNRDPVLHLSDVDVEEALASCQKKGLVIKITGGRAERWRHALYDAWTVGNVELAILAELLLRGPQTEGELRGRASRMEPIADLEALRTALRPLVERRLVVFLGEEGRRGTLIAHGFYDQQDLERLRAAQGAAAETVEPRPAAPEAPRSDVREQLAALRADLTQLQTTVAQLAEQLKTLIDKQGPKPKGAASPAQAGGEASAG
jgi:hypothetical protein